MNNCLIGFLLLAPMGAHAANNLAPSVGQAAGGAINGSANTCNILDKMPASGDATVAFTSCLATDARVILFPPGNYEVKSLVTTLPEDNLPSAGFVVNGQSDLQIEASGASFTMANAIQAGGTSFFVAYNDAKNITWDGGTFTVNPKSTTTLDSPLLNVAAWESTTNLIVENTVMYAGSATASAFAGVYGFGNTLTNNWASGFSIGVDGAYNENLTIQGNTFIAGGVASAGIWNQADGPTYNVGTVTNTDGNAGSLKNGQTNGLRILDNTLTGFHTQVALDDVNGALVDGNTLLGPATAWNAGNNAGILISTSASTHAQGYVTQNVRITDNTISGNGSSTTSSLNAGILISDGTYGLKNIEIDNNSIYDNCGNGIGPVNISMTTGLSINNNDFKTRGGACTQVASVAFNVPEPSAFNIFIPFAMCLPLLRKLRSQRMSWVRS